MTNQEYKKLKQTGNLSVELAFEFWKENKKPEYREVSLEEFAPKFQQFMQYQGQPIPAPDSSVKIFTMESIINKIFNWADKKYV